MSNEKLIEELMIELIEHGRMAAERFKTCAWDDVPEDIKQGKNAILTKLIPITGKTRKELLREARYRREAV